jgi:opacity protein-like surface antigen
VKVKALVLGAAILATFDFGSTAARAADGPSGSWTFEFTPYIWGAGMSGEVESGPLPAIKVNMSFSDILKNLDAGLMGAFEARRGRFGLLFDAIYMKLSDSGTASRTGPGPIGATATASAELEMRQTMYAAAVAYRVDEGRGPIDVIGGVRYSKIAADAKIDGSFFNQAGSVDAGASKDWVDPTSASVPSSRSPSTGRSSVMDIGGFGIGSEFTWQAALGVNYEFSKTFAGKIGYRYIAWTTTRTGFATTWRTAALS